MTQFRIRISWRDERGGAALEFALVLPVLVAVLIGGIYLANLAFASNSLHFAVQEGARCAAVKTTVCSDATTTITYAQNKYSGPRFSPTFAYAHGACGHSVSANGNFPLVTGFGTLQVPVSAAACYPA